jgi:hypothetical protein
VKPLLVLNAGAVLWAVYLSAVQPCFTGISVGMRYVQLDRAGAINHTVLGDPAIFHPTYGFSTDDRSTVPRYIAQPALHAQRCNAFLLLGLALANVAIAAIAVFVTKNTNAGRQTLGATGIDQPQGPPSGP